VQGNKIFKRIFADKSRTMRATFIFSILFVLLLPAVGQQHIHKLSAPYEHLKVSGNIHLRLLPSDVTYLEFESAEFPESLTISQDKDQLLLRGKTELKQSPALECKLYIENLSQLVVSRAAVVHSSDTLPYETLSLKVETGGKAEITVASDSLNARVSQGSDIILYGTTRILQVNANTVGNCLAYDLQATHAWVKAATGSQVKVKVSGLLNANAAGKSFVGYMGDPEVKEFTTSLGGEITPQTE
jgi:hypothetical protein